MRLGISTHTYMWSIGFEGARPEAPLTAIGLLKKAHALDVRVVQMGPNLPLDELPSEELQRFLRLATDWDIQIEVGTRGLDPAHLARQVALCQRVGSSLLRTTTETDSEAPAARDLPAILRESLPALAASGVRLGLENAKIPALQLRNALEQVGSRFVGIVLDPINSLEVPEGWRYVAQTLAPHTMCLHLKDFIIRRAWHSMGFVCEGRPVGKGQLNVHWLLETLSASQHDPSVVIELWTPEQKTLAETIALEQEWAQESVRYMHHTMCE
ncbi:MAG: TIM barrel protein [Anaerolineales bacterium]|nr:TIM barrel protein [Anaerolineales bacterium]